VKILQMVDVPWDSGLAHYALVLAQGLKNKGHQVFVSTVPGEKPWIKAHRFGLKTIPMVKLTNLGALRRFIREHGVQVINAHTGSTHSLAVAAALGQKVAVVRTRSDARAFRRRPGSQFLYRHTHRVITAADYIRKSFLKEAKLNPKKVVTIYQGIDVDDFSVGPLPKQPVLGIVARLDPVKGHRYLIEAMYLLKAVYPNLRLHVIGQEENIKIRELRTIAERLRVDNQIEFSGFLPDISKAMNECSIGIVSSIGSEAVSRVALEWMASGRPVVATNVGCLPEIVQEGVTGYLAEPKDAPSLAAAIAKVLHDPDKAKSLAGSGLSRAKRHFSMSFFIDKTLEIYKAALKECS
jgi:glycosyltransferase involved in cell wall biosynthesis